MSAKPCGCDLDCQGGPYICYFHRDNPTKEYLLIPSEPYIPYVEKPQPVVPINPNFHATLNKIAALHDKKSADYATDQNRYSNFEEAAKTAGCSVDTVFMVLLGIKLARLRVLLSSGKVPDNESIRDSQLDLATYATLWASYEV